MRIGLNTPDPQAASTEKTKKSSGSVHSTSASKAPAKPGAGEDTLTLSALSGKAMETPEIRHEKVDALRQSVTGGQYQPDSNESAEAILNQ